MYVLMRPFKGKYSVISINRSIVLTLFKLIKAKKMMIIYYIVRQIYSQTNQYFCAKHFLKYS